MAEIIVSDAGPLIAFSKIKQLNLISRLFGEILVPEAVLDECLKNPSQPGAQIIQKALDENIITKHKNPNIDKYLNLFDLLGAGEGNAIILADQLKIPLLIDEKLGRKMARNLQIPIIGSAGILLLAKKNKYIKKIKPIILELKREGYFFSNQLIKTVLLHANEI